MKKAKDQLTTHQDQTLKGLNMQELLDLRDDLHRRVSTVNERIAYIRKVKADAEEAAKTVDRLRKEGGTVVHANPFPDGRSSHMRLGDWQ